MAVQVQFYKLAKRRNSTKTAASATGYVQYDCKIKDGCSVLSPIIVIQWDGTSSIPFALAEYNYCVIPKFGARSYFIENWTYADRQWTANCSVDVLATYKTQIGALTKYVLRSASQYDVHAIDTLYPSTLDPIVETYRLSMPTWATSYDQGVFVMGISGENGSFSSGGVTYLQMTRGEFEALMNGAFVNSLVPWNSMPSSTDFGDAMREFGINYFKSINNPFQYINSLKWFPFAFPVGAAHPNIYLGKVNTGATGYEITNPILTINRAVTLATATMGTFDWENVEPYVNYRLVCPPFGVFDLDSRILAKSGGCRIFFRTDAISGEALMWVQGNVPYDDIILQASAQVGVTIPISGIQEQGVQRTVDTVTTAGSLLRAGLGGFLTGGFAGVDTAMGNVANAVVSNLGDSYYTVMKSGGAGGGVAGVASDKQLIVTRYPHTALDPDEYGYPLNQLKTLNTLTGFIICSNGDNDCGKMDYERVKISEFLTRGFYYE